VALPNRFPGRGCFFGEITILMMDAFFLNQSPVIHAAKVIPRVLAGKKGKWVHADSLIHFHEYQ
jgi:hypothetical protein